MKDLLKTVETFLTYSEAKLEELSEKNQQLKTELPRKEFNQDTLFIQGLLKHVRSHIF